jgi:hypothetical protein
MSDLLDDAAKRADRYLESLNTRSVAPGKEAVAALAGFDQAFPEHTSTAEAVLAELDEIGSPATMASAGGRFFGFVIGGALPVTVAANWLAVQRDGTCWCGGTVWQGRTAMRISVSSWATTEADVQRSLAAILRVASY